MTIVYPTVFTPVKEGGYVAYVPDLEINSQGNTFAEAIEMARDAISIICIDREDDGKPLPVPSASVPHEAGEIVSFIDADLTAYRQSIEKKTIRRNVSLPSWLDYAAREAGINVSAILVNALKSELHLENA